MSKERFPEMLQEQGIDLSDRQLEQFAIYYETLVDWNEKMNLTAITDCDDVYLKHFYDSLTAGFYVDLTQPLKVIDVGAGAGFPSIPLKIVFPHLEIHIVDSLKKRIGFLEHLAEKLQLTNVYFYHDRAETFGQNKNYREQYDFVIARAVARMPVLAELCLPLVKIGGQFLAMKGSDATEEMKEGKKVVTVLGGEFEKDFSFQLPIEESTRHLILVKKVKATPKKYPRKPGTPNKQPII